MNLFATRSVIWTAKVGILLTLLAALVAISQSSLMTADDLFPTALAIDFLITLPVAYFILIRRTAVPKITLVPVFFFSFLIASFVLPDRVAFMNLAGGLVVPAAELGVLGYLAFRLYRTRETYRDGMQSGSDLMERLRTAFSKEIKPSAIARAAAFEAAIFAYTLIKWRRRPVDGMVFTYHRESSAHLIVGVFLFLIAVETIGIHLLLALWSETLAWVATALSIYLALQLFAHLKALLLRPVVVTEDCLYLRCGILGDAIVPRGNVGSAEMIGVTEYDDGGIDLLPLGAMSQPNIQLSLMEPVTVYGVYGLKKTGRVIRLCVDDPDAFAGAIR
jgi:hypothetical protein